jgi:D-alanyl-D-alanine carboxypeptidase
MTGFRSMPALLGHSGLSGAFLFHAPQLGVHYAGTVNRIEAPGAAFRLLARAALLDARRAR